MSTVTGRLEPEVWEDITEVRYPLPAPLLPAIDVAQYQAGPDRAVIMPSGKVVAWDAATGEPVDLEDVR